MPNTLAHIGGQGPLTHAAFRDADPKWIYLGCVIPDLPWILQRIIRVAIPSIDLFALRAYVVAQASLLNCLILCVAIALLTKHMWRVGAVLGANVGLHLVIDALQTKWANGVHFLAPWSWSLANWGLFWPESWITYVLTGLGLAFVVVRWRTGVQRRPASARVDAMRRAGSIALIGAYFALPLLLLQGPVSADNHFLKTLGLSDRAGHYVECDRAQYRRTAGGEAVLQCWNAEPIRVKGLNAPVPATVSVRGVFVDDDTMRVIEHHIHSGWFREGASYVGLALTLMIWMIALSKHTAVQTSTANR